MKMAYMFVIMLTFLFGLAIFFPHNGITGKVITPNEANCGPLGCVKLCEQDSTTVVIDVPQNVCKKDMICCKTHWESGVCDYSFNCEKVRQYSLYQSLETYKSTVIEQPAPVQPTFEKFYLPLIVIIALICIVIFKYRNPHQDLHD